MKIAALALLCLCLVSAVPLAATDENAIVISGTVTHVSLELEFIVVTSNYEGEVYVDILLPCPASTPGCTEVEYEDKVIVIGHFNHPVAVCDGFELPDNPIVIDKLACVSFPCGF